MQKNPIITILILIFFPGIIAAQADLTVIISTPSEPTAISPYIYGKNNSLSDDAGRPLSEAEWQKLRDLGIMMFREGGGNNSTKYNWRRKLTSHPDWYNNVFHHDWDYAARNLQEHIPYAQGLWSFQLVGKAARSGNYNFSSWDYNRSQGWEGVRQNLCGGGTVNPEGGEKALVEGDTSLYLEDWNSDSTVGILNHWFGAGGLDLDSSRLRYWNADNEPEIWNGTHDDVWEEQPDAEEFIQRYIDVAKKARAAFPGIKLAGPVPANEWQWYNWDGSKITYKGKSYVWLEFFIMRIAEEQEASGISLLDVLDIHFYPTESDPEDIVQLHRVYFDREYNYPGANGVKRAGDSGWDASITREYIFGRCADWLEKYMGPDHGVGFAVTETGIQGNDPNVCAVWYASTLGEFARNGVEIFTPWSWKTGMYEVIHMFTKYGHDYLAEGVSSEEEYISVYPTVNSQKDSLTLFLVNRHLDQTKSVDIAIEQLLIPDGIYSLLQLEGLPGSETFISSSENALKEQEIDIRDNAISLALPPLSVSALVLKVEADSTTGNEWRSSLYPPDWKPGYKDAQGRFLHDFSHAGYHGGSIPLPTITTPVVDITQSPYNADNTGINDVTSLLQQALDDVGSLGGGVVYLPPGTYRIRRPSGEDHCLWISHSNTVLRGAGPDSTFIFHDETYMRKNEIIYISGTYSSWFSPQGTTSNIRIDLNTPTHIIPVASVSGFQTGDQVIVCSTPTAGFIEEHGMTGSWTASAIKGVAFKRRIDSIDMQRKLLILDTPTRYPLKTRDMARVYHARSHLRECGIEGFSIGNRENSKTGWDEESYSSAGTGAYDVHFSTVIKFEFSENCWVKNVHTYRPEVNSQDIHVLSNCLLLNMCRHITVDSCDFQKPQYEGGGGNGYMYTLQSNDCLIKNSRANHSRHNYDFKYPFSNGNVIHNCRGENSKYSSDFHMYLSMSNLFDKCTMNGDYLESMFRPYGGSAIHGYSSTQSVFYNTFGENYHPNRDYIVDSRQYKWGYVIGTSGPAYRVKTDPVYGTMNGYAFDTSPRDFVEGSGEGAYLKPASLYLDQLEKRKVDSTGLETFRVVIEVKDLETGELLPGCQVTIFNETLSTDASGRAEFHDVPEMFIMGGRKDYYLPFNKRPLVIYSDTVLTIHLESSEFEVTFILKDELTLEPFWGVSITLDGSVEVSDDHGEARFNVPAGHRDYSFKKISYREEAGSVEVLSDTSITFLLTRTHADLKIWTKENGIPVNRVVVKIGDDSLTTTSLGLAKFLQLPVYETYEYSARKEGYDPIAGNIYLSTDTTFTLEMLRIDPLLIHHHRSEWMEIWPNPAANILYCSLPDHTVLDFITIVDLQGKILHTQEVNKERISISLDDFSPGTYLLFPVGEERLEPVSFIKK